MQRRFRLRNGQDFERLRQEGRVYRTDYLLMSVRPNALDYNRYGFVTSKQLGKAVSRNRVRRLMRETIRWLHPRLQPGFDVALIARKSLVGEPFSTCQRIVEKLAYQAGIVVKGSQE